MQHIMDKDLSQRKRIPLPATPPVNWRDRCSRKRQHDNAFTENTVPAEETESPTVYEFGNDTWEFSPPPPIVPVDSSKGILRYRDPGDAYGRWSSESGPPKTVKFADNHRTRYYQNSMKNCRQTPKKRPKYSLTNENDPYAANQTHNEISALEEVPQAPIESATSQPPAHAFNLGSVEDDTFEEDFEMTLHDLGNSENTQGLYQNSEEEIVSKKGEQNPLFLELRTCDHPIENIVAKLTSQAYFGALLQHLSEHGITTIGDLSSKKPADLDSFSITSPKAETVRNALRLYSANLIEQEVNDNLLLDELDVDDDCELEEYVEVTSPTGLENDSEEEDGLNVPQESSPILYPEPVLEREQPPTTPNCQSAMTPEPELEPDVLHEIQTWCATTADLTRPKISAFLPKFIIPRINSSNPETRRRMRLYKERKRIYLAPRRCKGQTNIPAQEPNAGPTTNPSAQSAENQNGKNGGEVLNRALKVTNLIDMAPGDSTNSKNITDDEHEKGLKQAPDVLKSASSAPFLPQIDTVNTSTSTRPLTNTEEHVSTMSMSKCQFYDHAAEKFLRDYGEEDAIAILQRVTILLNGARSLR